MNNYGPILQGKYSQNRRYQYHIGVGDDNLDSTMPIHESAMPHLNVM